MWSTPVSRTSQAVFVFPLLHPKMSLWICTSKPLWGTGTGEFMVWSLLVSRLWDQETAIMWFHACPMGSAPLIPGCPISLS